MVDVVTAIKNKVLVTNIESGAKLTPGGIIIPDDDKTERGIRARWGEVYAVGPEVNGIEPGNWVLISHGRWSRGVDIQGANGKITLRQVDYPDGIMLVADKQP